jgi:hypothetical protein
MAKFFLTFGQRYAREPHPTFPKAHPDGYVVIEADLYEDAREKACEVVGLHWSDLYRQDEWFRLGDVTLESMFPLGELAHYKVSPLDIFDRNDSL